VVPSRVVIDERVAFGGVGAQAYMAHRPIDYVSRFYQITSAKSYSAQLRLNSAQPESSLLRLARARS
jgi:hypothetical protein